MLRRPRLRLVRYGDGFAWHVKERMFDPDIADPLFTIWCSYHLNRDDAIDYYNDILEVFNAESN